MEKTRYHHGNLKTELISAGFQLADRSGFDAVSLRELARDTKVTPAAALRHFADLSHLRAEISQEARQELARQCLADWEILGEKSLSRVSTIARFDALGRRYVRFAQEHLNLFNSAFALCAAMPSQPDDPSPWGLLSEVVDELNALDVIRPELKKEAALIAWSMVHGLATLQSHNLIHVSGYTGDLGDLVVLSLHSALFTNK